MTLPGRQVPEYEAELVLTDHELAFLRDCTAPAGLAKRDDFGKGVHRSRISAATPGESTIPDRETRPCGRATACFRRQPSAIESEPVRAGNGASRPANNTCSSKSGIMLLDHFMASRQDEPKVGALAASRSAGAPCGGKRI